MHTSMKIRHRPNFKASALAIAMKRKEEYLGARVPRELKERVINRAEELDIPVSTLIRKVLEDAFGDQRRSTDSQAQTKNSADKEIESANSFPSVLGWESIRLNRSAPCTGCGRVLKAGKQVVMGISPPEEERILLCEICKESL